MLGPLVRHGAVIPRVPLGVGQPPERHRILGKSRAKKKPAANCSWPFRVKGPKRAPIGHVEGVERGVAGLADAVLIVLLRTDRVVRSAILDAELRIGVSVAQIRIIVRPKPMDAEMGSCDAHP
eukprot:scaffold7442_cov258-Pinguiococcus_pyrenoidosus.AAC.2